MRACVTKACAHRLDHTETLFESDSDSLDNSLRCFLSAHTHKDTRTHRRSHVAFRWQSGRGQLIINTPAKRYYISSRARHWPRGSPKKCHCSPPNKVNAVAGKLLLFLSIQTTDVVRRQLSRTFLGLKGEANGSLLLIRVGKGRLRVSRQKCCSTVIPSRRRQKYGAVRERRRSSDFQAE